ncbi:lipocalin-like domain protein [Duganella sp. FT80W]|uniref:Lipocalin-like domain protein n=1 Tax=Duganella guangzhouensis TaxID=2666084 RepID=A0A6I2L635_9BURK|nr:lipocalin-like domain-containing protein [Duganella guangzhouensis]MRW93102.1 lipocalin-like domain protein [Duganella guangzhouensis]
MKLLNRLFCLFMWVPAHQAALAARPFPLAGAWELVAADRLQTDGQRVHDYGEAPTGLLMIDTDGHYALQIYQRESPRASSTHFGTLSIDEPSRTLTFHITSAQREEWIGTRQERRYELKGDELSYRVPARTDGQIPISVWRRKH